MAVARKKQYVYNKHFLSSDWYNHSIEILREGVPSSGQLGPHKFPIEGIYKIKIFQIVNNNIIREVEVYTKQNPTNGNVYIKKSPLTPNFEGVVCLTHDYYK